MMALFRAIVAAGTSDDVKAIRAAFYKAFPMLGDKFPAESSGINKAGRFYVFGSIQTVRNGKFAAPSLYDWFSKTPQEYNKVKKMTKTTAPVIWFKYAE